MMSHTRHIRMSLVVLLLLAVAVVAVGCASAASRNTSSQGASAARSATAVRGPSAGAKLGAGSQGSLSTTEAQALDAQLRAIEEELDTNGMPGDESVEAIEAGLK